MISVGVWWHFVCRSLWRRGRGALSTLFVASPLVHDMCGRDDDHAGSSVGHDNGCTHDDVDERGISA